MKRTFLQLILLLLCAPLLLTGKGCSSDEGAGAEDNPLVPIELSADEAEVSENLNGFTFGLLREAVNRSREGENVAVSPLGATMVAAMFGNAMNPAEQEEMLRALGVSSMEGLNAYCSKMLEALPNHDKSSRLVLANGAWFDTEETSLTDSYRRILSENFMSEVKSVDFGSPSLLPEINGWVKEKTDGLIPKFLEGIDEGETALWLNTIYFNGRWRNCERKVKAEPGEFKKEDGTKVKTEMLSGMRMASWGHWVENEDTIPSPLLKDKVVKFSTVEYGNGGFALTLAAPLEGMRISDVVASLSDGFMNSVKTAASDIQTNINLPNISLPKLDISMETDLVEPMKSLGLRKVFEKVEMPGIGMEESNISRFFQKLRLSFDEEGTKMAAVTVAGGSGAYLPPYAHFNFPFVYLIWEKSTGAVLMAGTVMDPTK